MPAGAWQAHTPGDSFRGIAERGYELVRLAIAEPAIERMLSELDLGSGAAALEFLDRGAEPSVFLLSRATELRAVLADRMPCSRLCAESLTTSLLSHMIVKHSNLADAIPAAGRSAGRSLLPWQARRARTFIADQIERDFSLAELAAAVGLSPYHFARAFKATTGLPPHRYKTMLRIARAKDLLTFTDQHIAAIAQACGFASSQHLATSFRRLVGVTPSSYRKERLS